MVAKTFLIPFAADGDRTPAIPDAQQSDGSVSYTIGYGPDYEKQLGVDPDAKNISREAFNSALNDITVALQELQSGSGLPAFSSVFAAALPGGGYPRGAVVPRADNAGYWKNQNAGASSADPTIAGSGWVPLDVIGTFTQALTNVNVAPSPSDSAFTKIILTGALTANVVVTLPNWSGYAWLIDNRCTGAFTVTVKTPLGTVPLPLAKLAVTNVYCDGAELRLLSFGRVSASSPVGSARNARLSIPTSSATTTYLADELIVGTPGGATYKLQNVSLPINIAIVGAGGMDVGAAPVSGYVGVYCIYNPLTDDAKSLTVNATATAAPELCAGVIPAGYTASALVSVLRTSPTALLGFAEQVGRKVSHGTVATLGSAVIQATYVALAIANSIPKNAKAMHGVLGIGSSTASSTSSMALASNLAGAGEIQAGLANAPANLVIYSAFSDLIVSTQQTLYYKLTSNGTILNGNIYTNGFTF